MRISWEGTSDSSSSAEEEVVTESAKKKRERATTSWAHLLVTLVPFNAAALGQTSLAALSKRRSQKLSDPDHMYECVLHEFSDTAKHERYSLVPLKTRSGDLLAHAETFHSTFFVAMCEAEEQGLVLESVFGNLLEQARTSARANKGSIAGYFKKKSRAEKQNPGLLERHGKLSAFTLWLVDSQSHLNSTTSPVFKPAMHRVGWQPPQVASFRDTAVALALVVKRIRQEQMSAAGWLHFCYDFYDGPGQTEYLLLTGTTLVCMRDGQRSVQQFPLGVVEYHQRHFSALVAACVKMILHESVPSNVTLATSNVDGALLSSATRIVADHDTNHCFGHRGNLLGEDVFVKGELVVPDIVKDVDALNGMMVAIKSSKILRADLKRAQREAKGADGSRDQTRRRELKVQVLGSIRWTRFLRILECAYNLRRALILMYNSNNEFRAVLASLNPPHDFLRKDFFHRVKETISVIKPLQTVIEHAQISNRPSMSLLLIKLLELKESLVIVEESRFKAIDQLKTNLASGLTSRFGNDLSDGKSLLLRAARLDPRTSNLRRLGVEECAVETVDRLILHDHLDMLKAGGKSLTPRDIVDAQSALSRLMSRLEAISDDFLGDFPDVGCASLEIEVPAHLQHFLDGPSAVVPRSKRKFEDLDPIAFYSGGDALVEEFSSVAFMLLSVPSGTGRVESLGSEVNYTLDSYVTNIKDVTIDHLLSIRSYTRSPGFDLDEFLAKVSEVLEEDEAKKAAQSARKKK